MDALAALGLASNILSFVDFTWKLLAGANEIYASGAGISDDAQFLDTITKDVRYYDERIVAVPNATPELKSLARQCDEIAQDLLESLDKLRIKGHKTRWNSFLVALRGVRSKKKVEQLTDKIAKIQSRMTAHMQELLLHNVSGLSRAIKELQLTHINLGIAIKDEVPSLKQEIQDALEKLVDENSTPRMKEYFQQRQAQELSPGLIAEVSAQMQRLAHAMGNLELRGTEAGSNHKLLKKLYFKSISTRERKIEKAHSSTFQWLVNSDQQPKQCLDFTTWLRRGTGVFWIHGKPGSGKSTFMKFVCNQEVVRDYIQDWANGDQLVTASFYFWYAGSRLQNSLEGLLRTLLFEMLRHVPGVIPSITSDSKLKLPLSYDEDWDLDTLFKMYDIVLRGQRGVKFCFFIDGLDEFKDEDHRSLRDLITALRRLETSDNMKLCVGSRSWVEFADIYGHVPCKSLKLEDLTRNDIQNYVKDRFNSHEQFSRLQETDPNYEGLVSEVVDRAQGVFLWVRLVVQMLLEGFTFHDSVNTLRQRLTSFPEDLEEFFDHMLKSIPSAYRGQAAQTFKVATEVDQPRLLIFYYFLDEELQRDPLTLNSSYTPLDPLEVSAKCEKMRRQLNARSRGLLEITTDDNDGERSASTQGSDSCYFDSKVDFLHRTVRDFLVSPRKTLDFFNSNVGNNTDLSIAAAKAAFDQVKFAEFSGPTQFSRLVDIFFSHTRHAAGVSESTTKLDDVLEAAEELCIEIRHRNDWAQSVYFLGLAAQSGHTSFFERKFSTGHHLVAMEPHQPYLASSSSNRLLRSKHPLSSSTNASSHLLGWIRKRPSSSFCFLKVHLRMRDFRTPQSGKSSYCA
ncbi:hypothetical protein PG987_006058 [Apiospora arundinis]